jgi:hypothetical protein
MYLYAPEADSFQYHTYYLPTHTLASYSRTGYDSLFKYLNPTSPRGDIDPSFLEEQEYSAARDVVGRSRTKSDIESIRCACTRLGRRIRDRKETNAVVRRRGCSSPQVERILALTLATLHHLDEGRSRKDVECGAVSD